MARCCAWRYKRKPKPWTRDIPNIKRQWVVLGTATGKETWFQMIVGKRKHMERKGWFVKLFPPCTEACTKYIIRANELA